jgi:FixJ family two-component response regulator
LAATASLQGEIKMHHCNQAPFIKIIDDDPQVRKAFQRLLRLAGFEVETFASGEDFFRTVDDCQPDCLLLDLDLPGMSGFEVRRQLQVTGMSFPIIVVTGRDDLDPAHTPLLAGVAAFLFKPVEVQDLLSSIEKALRK